MFLTVVLQLPQVKELVLRLVQAPKQQDGLLAGHCMANGQKCKCGFVEGVLTVTLQDPQFLGSVVRFVQLPEQQIGDVELH